LTRDVDQTNNRCLKEYKQVVVPEPTHQRNTLSDAPPADFFDPFLLLVEIRDVDRKRSVYTSVLRMGSEKERGKLFTTGGCAVVGSGLRPQQDVRRRWVRGPNLLNLAVL
jgi:hypothetical protein